MTSRSKTREFSDFLVQFDEDQSFLVVPRSRILTDCRVRVGVSYDTVWGQPHEFDSAVVIATGEWLDLTRQMNQLKIKRDIEDVDSDDQSTDSPDTIYNSPTQPKSPTPPSTPVAKKKKGLKPDATLLDVGSPPPTTIMSEPITPIAEPVEPTTPNQATPSSYRSSIPMQMTTINKKMDVMNKRILSLELAQQKTLQKLHDIEERTESRHLQVMSALTNIAQLLKNREHAIPQEPAPQPTPIESSTPAPTSSRFTIDFPQPAQTRPPVDHFSHVDHPNRITQEVLHQMYRDTQANGVGNFSLHIVRKLFPELFTREHLRQKYSYYGGGKLEKQPRNPTRLDLVRQYVCVYYPETQHRELYKATVVSKINECLRRPIEQKKKVCRDITIM